MSLEKEDVEKIALLARLQISEQDIPDYAQQLSSILDLVEQMNSADTSDVMPMAHPQDEVQSLRADEITEPNRRDLYQCGAPSVEAGLYLVPRVIE